MSFLVCCICVHSSEILVQPQAAASPSLFLPLKIVHTLKHISQLTWYAFNYLYCCPSLLVLFEIEIDFDYFVLLYYNGLIFP